jgi:hypothetical protein
MRRIALALSLLVAALSLGSTASFAFDYNGSPVASLLAQHATAQINQQIAAGWRPTSIEYVGSTAGVPFYRVNYVQNTGSHYKQVKFLGSVTGSTLDSAVAAGYHVEDVALVGDKWSAILIRNTASTQRTTLYFGNWTAGDVEDWLHDNPTWRLLDLDRNSNGNFTGVYLQNLGPAAASWGWSPGMTWDQIGAWANANGQRVIDLDRRTDGLYTVVFAQRNAGQRYYYFGNRTFDQVLAFLGGYGLRVQTISETKVGSTPRFSGVAVNNVFGQAARIADLKGSEHNGVQGFYVERVGGPRVVDLNASRAMHPSSTIKALLHYTAIWDTPTSQLNTRTLGGQSMTNVLSTMMLDSNNTSANIVLDTYGSTILETLGRACCGMTTTTQIRNRFGTGGPYTNPAFTETTLVDLGGIYRAVQTGRLDATKTAYFRNNMLNETRAFPWENVFQSVRSEIGISTSRYNDFRSRVRSLLKAGSNEQNGTNGYWSIAGVLRLPNRSGNVVVSRDWLFGHFVNGSTIDYRQEGWDVTAELLREQIREAMLTFK